MRHAKRDGWLAPDPIDGPAGWRRAIEICVGHWKFSIRVQFEVIVVGGQIYDVGVAPICSVRTLRNNNSDREPLGSNGGIFVDHSVGTTGKEKEAHLFHAQIGHLIIIIIIISNSGFQI